MNNIINIVPGNNGTGSIAVINITVISTTTLPPPATTTSSADAVVVATTLTRLVGAAILTIFVVAAVTINTLLLIVYSKGSAKFKSISPVFFAISWQCLLADFQCLIPQVLVVLPETFAGQQLYPDWVVYFLGCFDTYGYESAFLFAFLLTANRFCTFLLPRVDRLLFRRPRIFIFTTAIWVFVITITIFWNIEGCYKSFDTGGFYLYSTDSCFGSVNTTDSSSSSYSATSPVEQLLTSVSVLLFTSINNVLGGVPQLMVAAYVVIYVKIRLSKSGHSDSENTNERLFALQSFVICMVYLVEYISFSLVPVLPLPGQWGFVANFVTDYIVIICESINAIVIFSFNHTARNVLMEDVLPDWFTRRKRRKKTTTLTNGIGLQGPFTTTTAAMMVKIED